MIKMDKEEEIETFEEAWKYIHEVEQNAAVLSADLARHTMSLKCGSIARTSDMQATLSLKEIETIIDELKKANDALLRILLKSGE